jgi:exopolyphosphatase/guanosine-5'-triphosphate,3'-diphosphate pyrophosphatase
MRYAAVDIGSNSTRMLAAEVLPGEAPRTLAAEREVTRLGLSVFRDGRISADAMESVVSLLARMAAIYRRLEVAGVRVVATSAVRDASNQAEFLALASDVLGSPVEIISGREEARLIHQGVMWHWPQPGKRALVVDIGGGSAEIISSADGRMLDAVSRPLGAVRLQEMFLKSDPPAAREVHQMNEFIDQKLGNLVDRMGLEWERVIATSASAAAVVCAINRVPRARRDQADRMRASTAEIRKLFRRLAELDLAGRRKVPGIGPRRAEIAVAGTGALLRILDRFQARGVYYSSAGVRDGIIADMAARNVGAEQARLSREQRKEVERVASRFGIPLDDARQVAGFSRALFERLSAVHQLAPAFGRLLEAACYLCNTGHYISDASHHKHSYYVVANADFSGFTNREQQFIAALCRYHRKALPVPAHPEYQVLAPDDKRALNLLIPLLRLADSLERSRGRDIELARCDVQDGWVQITLRAPHEPDLAEWSAERVSGAFRQFYGRDIAVEYEQT